jgi:hypothetical protein
MSQTQPQPTRVLGDKVWCPFCAKHVKLVRVSTAARIVDVDRRTVYNFVKSNKVFGIKIAQGTTLRVCTSCLLQPNDNAQHSPDQQDNLTPNEELEIDS